MRSDDVTVNGVKLREAPEAEPKDRSLLILPPARTRLSGEASGAT